MKRLTYISKAAPHINSQALQEISQISSRNNQQQDITGILIFLGGYFYQVLEGESAKIDTLYAKIAKDERHTDLLCLKAEYPVKQRLFAEWSMNAINLDEQTGLVIEPVKTLLHTITESHRILEQYTQPSIVNMLNRGINPLTVQPKLTGKIIFFSDIVSFATFAEKLPVQEVMCLVNQYLTICTRCINAQGGEVLKFIGDSVMAAFAEEDADAALQAGLDIIKELSVLRKLATLESPLYVLYAGIGLAHGEVIEGNIGPEVKRDYTMIGDTVNVAARIEALTRHLPYSMVFSDSVRAYCQQDWKFVELGKHPIKGKSLELELFAIDEAVTHKSSNAEQTAHFIRQSLDEIKVGYA